jgi:hypothetical protein
MTNLVAMSAGSVVGFALNNLDFGLETSIAVLILVIRGAAVETSSAFRARTGEMACGIANFASLRVRHVNF